MTSTGRILAYLGGAVLGLLLGTVSGCAIGYFAFREPMPASHMERPGDWLNGIIDIGERTDAHARNLERALLGGLVGAGLGTAGGLLLAARATRTRPARTSDGGVVE
jgi:hypothetical protein